GRLTLRGVPGDQQSAAEGRVHGLRARADAEFDVDAPQMRLDRVLRYPELAADLDVGHAYCDAFEDLDLAVGDVRVPGDLAARAEVAAAVRDSHRVSGVHGARGVQDVRHVALHRVPGYAQLGGHFLVR